VEPSSATAPGAPATRDVPALTPGAADAARPRTASRQAVVVAALVALLVLAVGASLAVGSRPLPLGTVWQALWSPVAGDNDHLVVRDLRLPRTVVGLVAGAALGLSGALLQGLTRNPVADPGLLGINAGASLAVVVAVTTTGVTAASGLVWFAVAGAAVAGAVVLVVASLGWGGATPVKLALVGAAVNAVATSLLTLVVLGDRTTLDVYRFWSVGSLSSRGWDVVVATGPLVAVGVLLALGSARFLDAMALGDDLARGLGQRVGLGRAVVLVASVLLAGGATALAGPVVFVGLVVPHAVRLLVGQGHRLVLPCSLLAGPVLLLVADVVGRVVVPPSELQAGLVVALVGAPVLVAVVRRSRAVTA